MREEAALWLSFVSREGRVIGSRYQSEGFIALGWGGIGDMRTAWPLGPEDISDAVKATYPGLRNSHEAGRCLWALCKEMHVGELVILSDGKKRRAVVEVTGDYYWTDDTAEIGNYFHRRSGKRSPRYPERLWKQADSKVRG